MATASSFEKSRLGPPSPQLIILAFLGFVSLGLPDAAIGIAWPSIRETYGLRQPALGLLLIVSGLGYLVSSFCYGRMGRSWPIGSILTASTALVGLAMLGFAFSPWWILVVLCSGLHGIGSGAIDSGLNGYAAHHLPTRHLMWLHAFYCAGVMTGPVVMSTVFASGQTYRQGYWWIAVLLLTLCVIFGVTRQHWCGVVSVTKCSDSQTDLVTAFKYRIVRLQVLAFFLYTGLEVAFSQWTYTILTEHRGVSPVLASSAVAIYWAGLLSGRLLLGTAVDSVGCDRLVRYSLFAACVGGVLFVTSVLPVEVSLLGVGIVGVGLAPVFPCLISRTPSRLGPELATPAIGLQVGFAMMGGAVIPGLLGLTAGRWGLGPASYGISFPLVSLFLLHEILILLPRPILDQHAADKHFDISPAELSAVRSAARETLLDS